MVVIPAGSFDMGGGDDESAKPLHRVTIKRTFALSVTEVTQAQWRSLMGSNPSAIFKCGDNCPVDQVNWNDAQVFIKKLTAKTGQQYRLPTEAEWEYSCRAGEWQEYCGSDNINSVAWYGAFLRPAGTSAKAMNPVSRRQANAFGLYDMSGNVSEWVEDIYHEDYAGAPTDGSAWLGAGTERVYRGGAWGNDKEMVRASFRFPGNPEKRSVGIGLRVVRILP
jgi:formylglycine-generating enzyme required for sulfatase activity